jgi:hypothetical protein
MEQKKRLKMCPHCDGQIDLDALICPYCGRELVMGKKNSEENKNPTDFMSRTTPEETSASLYPPPYQPKIHDPIEQQEEILPLQETAVKQEEKENLLWPTLLFSFGANLLLLGLFLLFFSKQGELLLRWNGHYWFVYLLLGLPIAVLGYKGLNHKK